MTIKRYGLAVKRMWIKIEQVGKREFSTCFRFFLRPPYVPFVIRRFNSFSKRSNHVRLASSSVFLHFRFQGMRAQLYVEARIDVLTVATRQQYTESKQLRPEWTFTTDVRHARHTKNRLFHHHFRITRRFCLRLLGLDNK